MPVKASKTPRTSPKDQLAGEFDRVINIKLDEMRAELRDLVRTEVKALTPKGGTTEKAYERDIAALEARLRGEMEARLKAIAEERSAFDTVQITRRFNEIASKIVQRKADEADPETLAQAVSSAIRQAVLETMRSRGQHLSQLSKLDQLAREGDIDQLGRMLEEFFVEAGVRRVTDPSEGTHYFKAVNDPAGKPHLEVLEPALIDEVTGKLLHAGRVRHVTTPGSED